MEKYTALKRQQDSRFRQIDRFEASIKVATDKQGQWRQRLVSKQAELDAVKATNAELLSQISSLKTRSSLSTPRDNNKLTSLTTRANTANDDWLQRSHRRSGGRPSSRGQSQVRRRRGQVGG